MKCLSPWVVGLLLSSSSILCSAELPAENRILFLGDSITHGGRYVALIEAASIAAHPDEKKSFLNLGLSSETVSGLSEEGHAGGKFPRPDLHERLDRILTKTKPELVFACYGMNDGIYFPLSEERTRAYQEGMVRLREKVAAVGARIIHLTPPVFDPLPIAERVLPAGLEAYPKPFEGYNSVLDHYSEWLMSRRKAEGWDVLDVHAAMMSALDAHRSQNPEFSFSRDGVHPGDEGHAVMAGPILELWGLHLTSEGSIDHPKGKEILQRVLKKQDLLHHAWLSETGHKRPGVKPGLPLEEAELEAAKLDAEARALAK